MQCCGFWSSPISSLTFSLFHYFPSASSSQPLPILGSMQSAYLRVFSQLFGGEEKSAKGLEAYGATLSNLFFPVLLQDVFKAEDHVLWALLSQETHYLLLCSLSQCCLSDWGPRTSSGPLWAPFMSTFQNKNNLMSLLFHVLYINSVRDALAVWIFRLIPSVALKESFEPL